MASDTVRDYLGHPCAIAEASETFEETLKEARKLEARALARQVGIRIVEFNERIQHPGAAMQLVHDSLPNSDDEAPARAVLSMAMAYDVETCNRFCELAGHVLAALELGAGRLAPPGGAA